MNGSSRGYCVCKILKPKMQLLCMRKVELHRLCARRSTHSYRLNTETGDLGPEETQAS